MPPLVKNILAVLAGAVLGCVVNMGIIILGPTVIPYPEGVDMTDMDKFAENLKQLKAINFVVPWLAHGLGTLAGAWVAAAIATNRKIIYAMGIGAFFLLGGIMMVVSYGGPVPFIVLDLIGAYFPMAYLGGLLAGAGRNTNAIESEGA